MPSNTNTDTNPYALPRPELTWEADGAPRSVAFGDIYFSRAGGAEETDYVFLQQNRLRERWAALEPDAHGTFTIGETGFGTGLNFLSAAALWLAMAPASWRLHFVSVEKFPLDREELAQALAAWPQFAELSRELLAIYPPLLAGCHRRTLACGRIQLQLLFGDANELLPELLDGKGDFASGCAVDAWFLDGFAPSRNPTLWSERVLACVGRLSCAGSTIATFTAAGDVRRGLERAGFAIEKVPGYGRKRDMVRGVHGGEPPPLPPEWPVAKPLDFWAWPPAARARQRVIVIGGGLAGTSTARALAERGWPVTLLEAGPTLAAAASGNPRGVLYTKLSHRDSSVARFALSSWLHALAHYRHGFAQGWWPVGSGDFCGVLQLSNAETCGKLRKVFADQSWVRFLEPAEATALAGIPVAQPALLFPDAGWLAPAAICAGYVDHPLIEVEFNTPVRALEQVADGWRVVTEDGVLEAGVVVVAAAHATLELAPCAGLPLKAIRGQITLVPATALTTQPNTVICHDGYFAPLNDGGACIGATFDLYDEETQPRAESDRANLAALARALPGLLAAAPAAAVGFPASTQPTRPASAGSAANSAAPLLDPRLRGDDEQSGREAVIPAPVDSAQRRIPDPSAAGDTSNRTPVIPAQVDSAQRRTPDPSAAGDASNRTPVIPAQAGIQEARLPVSGSRVAFRCATPDYLPMVGAMPDIARMREQFVPQGARGAGRAGSALCATGPGAWLPGLYLNVGHGSKGLSSTPLCAELLAALISGEVRPLPHELMQALSPARFALRDLIRGRR